MVQHLLAWAGGSDIFGYVSLDDLDPQVQLGWHYCLISIISILTWESLKYPISSPVGVKSLLLNPVEKFSGVNSAEGVFEIKVVLPV